LSGQIGEPPIKFDILAASKGAEARLVRDAHFFAAKLTVAYFAVL